MIAHWTLEVALFLALGKFFLVGVFWAVRRAIPSLTRRTAFGRSEAPGQARAEWKSSWVIPLDGLVFWVLVKIDWLRFGSPSVAGLIGTFVGLFVFFETWFYVTHRLLHTKWMYRFHREHHRSRIPSEFTALRFSLVEKSILTAGSVGAAALGSLLWPIDLLGFTLFFLLYYAESVIGHGNVELIPPVFVRKPLGLIFSSPTFHAAHHTRGTGNFGLMSSLHDWLFGTVVDGYQDLHNRAWYPSFRSSLTSDSS